MSNAFMTQNNAFEAGFFAPNPFAENEEQLLVLQTAISGMHHRLEPDKEKEVIASLTPGTELMLYRDMNNEHDQWAISVYTKDDLEIGYITRFKNETIARLMDYGKAFHAYVDEPKEIPTDPTTVRRTIAPTEQYDKIPISIYMDV